MGGIFWLSRSRWRSRNSKKKLAAQEKSRHFLTVCCKTWVKISLSQQLRRLDLIVDLRLNGDSLLLRATKLSQKELVLLEWSHLPQEGHGFSFGLFARFSAACLRLSCFRASAFSFCFSCLCFAFLKILSDSFGSRGPVSCSNVKDTHKGRWNIPVTDTYYEESKIRPEAVYFWFQNLYETSVSWLLPALYVMLVYDLSLVYARFIPLYHQGARLCLLWWTAQYVSHYWKMYGMAK